MFFAKCLENLEYPNPSLLQSAFNVVNDLNSPLLCSIKYMPYIDYCFSSPINLSIFSITCKLKHELYQKNAIGAQDLRCFRIFFVKECKRCVYTLYCPFLIEIKWINSLVLCFNTCIILLKQVRDNPSSLIKTVIKMKTQIKTKKGTTVNFSIVENEYKVQAEIEIEGVHTSKQESFFVSDDNNVRGVGRFRGNVIQLELDQENGDKVRQFKQALQQAQEQREVDDYMHLQEQLPETTIPSGNNDKKAQQLIEEANSQPTFSGPETDGLNLASSAKASELMQEAHKHCNHNLETSYHRTHTADARKKIERTIECTKCGAIRKDSASDELSETAIWR